jgi:phage terminase small subunit
MTGQSQRRNVRRERFAEEYAKDFNATAAAIRAGYSAAGAKTTGWRLSQLPEVQEMVDRSVQRASLRTQREVGVTVADVVRGLLQVALAERSTWASKVTAWTRIGQHLGMFRENVDLGIERARQRAQEIAAEEGLPPEAAEEILAWANEAAREAGAGEL